MIEKRFPGIGKRSAPGVRVFLSLQLALAASLVPARVYEFVLVGTQHPLPAHSLRLLAIAVGNDCLLVALYSVLAVVPFLVVFLFKQTLAERLTIGVSALLLGITLLLDQYFAVTFIPLGADLLGYSLSDILLTAESSGGVSVFGILGFLIVLAVGVSALLYARRTKVNSTIVRSAGVAIILMACAAPYVIPRVGTYGTERENALIANKLHYFVTSAGGSLVATDRKDNGMPSVEFPFLHPDTTADVLSPFIALRDEKPNLVFIVVEGLGRSFVGEGAEFGGFMPFLDSLTVRSLYWENFLSTTGRTFGALPSIFGSLPYGENGFMELGHRMPAHISLISLLGGNGYATAYHYGGDINFDNQGAFLERQKIGSIVEQRSFIGKYTKAAANQEGFSWGYADGDLFEQALNEEKPAAQTPRLDIFLTLTTHEPFIPPENQKYGALVEDRLARLPWGEDRKSIVRNYRQAFASLIYCDAMLRGFFEASARQARYKNTIFILTGDHRVIPIPPANALDRFHVPLIIASPLVRHPERFASVSSHWDITPSILALLHSRYHLSLPEQVAWLGTGIDTVRAFRNTHFLPLMRNKNQLLDYVAGGHFVAGDQLYAIRDGLALEPEQNASLLQEIQERLSSFKSTSVYACANDKLYPGGAGPVVSGDAVREDSLMAALGLGQLSLDSLYMRGRSEAFAGRYSDARLICGLLLRDKPHFHDARVLLGRTYAWEGKYGDAEVIFREVLARAPHYGDAVVALADLDIWQGHYEVALALIGKEERFNPTNPELLLRKAKALLYSGKKPEALVILAEIQKIQPEYPEASEFRRRIGI